jgi:hypothetical protein
MLTVAKLYIEREIDEELGKDLFGIEQLMSPLVKHRTAIAVVKEAIPEAGVRSIRDDVMDKRPKELRHKSLLKTGGITRGSKVQYSVDTDGDKVTFRMVEFGSLGVEQNDEDEGIMVEDSELFG